ncbi:MAG: pentapeptide repeat-containing protein [Gemmatimonadaceae bacterium]|nr:pentapeptide repeat-containing protein [Gemmatimonadaceae bacterium]
MSNFDGTLFVDRLFEDLELHAADLTGKEFERCTFRRCKLPESRWANARLEDCVFEACDLSRMVPRRMVLSGVRFADTRLSGVDWEDLGLLPDVSFAGCDLRYASFVKVPLRAVRFVNCVIRDASFVDSDLTKADFTDTDLTGTSFRGCLLKEANLTRATGVYVDPQQNRAKGARISLEAAVTLVRSFGIVVE